MNDKSESGVNLWARIRVRVNLFVALAFTLVIPTQLVSLNMYFENIHDIQMTQ